MANKRFNKGDTVQNRAGNKFVLESNSYRLLYTAENGYQKECDVEIVKINGFMCITRNLKKV